MARSWSGDSRTRRMPCSESHNVGHAVGPIQSDSIWPYPVMFAHIGRVPAPLSAIRVPLQRGVAAEQLSRYKNLRRESGDGSGIMQFCGIPVRMEGQVSYQTAKRKPSFSKNRISVKPEVGPDNGFASLTRGAGTSGSCPAEPKKTETTLLPACSVTSSVVGSMATPVITVR